MRRYGDPIRDGRHCPYGSRSAIVRVHKRERVGDERPNSSVADFDANSHATPRTSSVSRNASGGFRENDLHLSTATVERQPDQHRETAIVEHLQFGTFDDEPSLRAFQRGQRAPNSLLPGLSRKLDR
jgi:hypothetical protein